MSYQIGDGIAEEELADWLKTAAAKYGTFDDGRVDYTNADIAPAVMCTVKCNDEILLVKRGYGLADAEGYWSTVNGFIDEPKPVTEQVMQEIREELGLDISYEQVCVGKSYTVQSSQEKRRYIIFPCLVTLSEKPKIVLDYEHTGYAWINRKDLESYKILDDLPHAIDSALAES